MIGDLFCFLPCGRRERSWDLEDPTVQRMDPKIRAERGAEHVRQWGNTTSDGTASSSPDVTTSRLAGGIRGTV